MADIDFERRLERLFAQNPELPDGAAFADRIEHKLSRGWATRRWLIGSGGVIGGVICASQLFLSNIAQRVESAGQSALAIGSSLSEVAPSAEMAAAFSGGMGLWIAVGLAVLTLGFALSRVIEEI